jgi:outer membrane protein insertion porin family
MRMKCIALLMLIFCLGGVFAQTNEDWYQSKPIRAITFDGLKNVARTELDGIFSSYLGKDFNDDLYWEVLQKLYSLEYFDDIQPIALPGDPDRKTVLLRFTVTEKPVIRAIKFTGNTNIRASELLDKVGIKEGDIYNEAKSRLDERAIRDLYLEKGYANVKVTSEKKTNTDSSISLYFTVVEGKQTVVSSITFEGNKVMASKTLKGALSLKEAKFFTSGTFQESSLEKDKAAIKQYYNERGYIDAVVENVVRDIDTTSNKTKSLLKLTFIIKEGDQYTYGGTTIEGNHIFKTEELLGKIYLKQGDVMNLTKMNAGFQALADVYFENGYTGNYINKQEKRDPDKKQVSYLITIAESARSHIEHIIIRGNTKTKLNVITRELSFEPGDIFSKSKLIDSMRNLYNLRYFSTIVPDIQQGSEQNLLDVVVALEEQSTASVQFGLTYSGTTVANSFPLSLFIEWKEANFRGNGQTISVSGTAAFDTQNVKLGYSENWFLGSPLTVDFSLTAAHSQKTCYEDNTGKLFSDSDATLYGDIPSPYNSYEEYSAKSGLDSDSQMNYDHYNFSLGAATGYRWLPRFAIVTLRGGVDFSVVQNVYDEVIHRPADKDIRDQHGKWMWNNSVWSRLSLDQRNINYDPTSGWFMSQQVTYFGILPNLETQYYARFDTKAEAYLTLFDIPFTDAWSLKAVLAAFSSFSWQAPIPGTKIADSNKLYIDGMFTGRGWTNLYSSSAKGNALLNHSLEVRVPIAPGIVALDFFMDAAAVKCKSNTYDLGTLSLEDYYFSYGPGIRFTIPQFPLHLLFANRFQIKNGVVQWFNKSGPDWSFVLSFNVANL